jgi:hypothetical protein
LDPGSHFSPALFDIHAHRSRRIGQADPVPAGVAHGNIKRDAAAGRADSKPAVLLPEDQAVFPAGKKEDLPKKVLRIILPVLKFFQDE